ncbi:MAG: hypothetical protein IJR92_01010 [Alphaproteobacteria bacterium]|nr:hypothetical protein [Alphaproteobacteria bacterium]
MQDRVEPPILLSRLLIFVFAGTVVVLFAMLLSLEKMCPLNRPQIFFLTSRPIDTTVQLTEMPPTDENMEMYKRAFVMEYVRTRNEIEKNTSAMRKKWGNADGIMASWSSKPVYDEFLKTELYVALTNNYPGFEFVCPVNIKRVIPLRENQYRVEMAYHCEDNNGQINQKNYTIRIGLSENPKQDMEWGDRMNNPLGLKVSEYTIENGEGDPLNTVYK